MGSIIVLNVAKHAMFKLLTMTGQPEGLIQIQCKFDTDPRLIAGASMIVAHVARRAGLEEQSVSELAAAALNVCVEMARPVHQGLSSHAELHLSATEFPDRIEITADLLPDTTISTGSKPSSDTSHDLEAKIRQQLKGVEVDGVNVGLRGGLPHVMLVKKSGTATRKFAV